MRVPVNCPHTSRRYPRTITSISQKCLRYARVPPPISRKCDASSRVPDDSARVPRRIPHIPSGKLQFSRTRSSEITVAVGLKPAGEDAPVKGAATRGKLPQPTNSIPWHSLRFGNLFVFSSFGRLVNRSRKHSCGRKDGGTWLLILMQLD